MDVQWDLQPPVTFPASRSSLNWVFPGHRTKVLLLTPTDMSAQRTECN